MSELTYESVLKLIKENSEENKRLVEETKRLVDYTVSKVTTELGRKIAEFGDTLGRFAEEQVKADVVDKFEKWGIPIHSYSTHCVHKDNRKNFLYEIDILIYNTDYVIALEVKNQLKRDHIEEHLERMDKIQKYPVSDLKDKILLGGVASMIVNEELSKYAESKGLFVIKPSGDSVKIANKKTFKPREWKVSQK